MRKLRNTLIPLLLLVVGLHLRKRKSSTYHRLTATGQVSSQTETRDRIVAARVHVQRVSPTDPKGQINVTVNPVNSIPRKTDQELRRDAEALEAEAASLDPDYRGQITFATVQDANGNLYYTMNGSGTPDARVRALAEDLGYNRIHGSAIRSTDSNHAEQQLLNALNEKQKAIDDKVGDAEPYRSLPVEPLRLSPSKQPCDDYRAPDDPKNQHCRSRSGTSLVGWP